MLNYAILIQVKQKLIDMSYITSDLNVLPGTFSNDILIYLNDFLVLSQEHNLYISSDIANTINKIRTFQSEQKNVTTRARNNERKEKDAFAVKCLESIHGVVKSFLEKDLAVVEECSNLCRQIVSRMLAKGHEEYLQNSKNIVEDIIYIAKSDQEFLPYYSHIIGLAGIYNARAIINIILPQLGLS